MTVAQILTFQAILYFFLSRANVVDTCITMQYSVVEYMAAWVPLKLPVTYYHAEVDTDTVTFRMIWFVSHSMEGFMGTFTIILCLFYVLDLVQTWFRPLDCFTVQKYVTPVFLAGAKAGQVIFFAIVGGRLYVLRWVNSVTAALQLVLTVALFSRVCYRQRRK